MPNEEAQSLTLAPRQQLLAQQCVPKIVAAEGTTASWAWDEYFSGRIRNPNTRKAYLHAVSKFLAWCEQEGNALQQVSPGMIGRYLDQHVGSAPTRKQHMSAIRGLFDTLVERHVLILNPAHSVRTERFSVTEGKTPLITTEQARMLLKSMPTETAIDLRDRAIISMLIYTAARVGAISRLKVQDVADDGEQMVFFFHEKGGKQRQIPARIDLRRTVRSYTSLLPHTEAAAPLFRTAQGRTGLLTLAPMSPVDICRMVKRRVKAADLPANISPHSFRSCTATDLLEHGVSIEDVQYLLGHSDPRVTRLYDRRQRQITRNIVERISV
ncbi:MAG: tyrosine-type recombinase/integrase [Fuerstiella sp.]